MPQISVDLLINRTLYATGRVDIYDAGLNVVATRQAGQVVGEVFSYVQRGGVVYLTLKPAAPARLVKLPGALTVSKADAEAIRLREEQRQRAELDPLRAERERAEMESKGKVRYYIEKYGPILLAVVAGTYLMGTYIKKRA